MRYLFGIFSIVLFTVACSSPTGNMQVSGTVKGLKKGTLILQKFEDTILVSVDSLEVDGNSSFVFSEEIESPEIYYLYVRLKDGSLRDDRIAFFAEPGNIEITTNLENFGSAVKVSGSSNDSLLRDYDKLKQRFVAKNLELIEKQLKLKGKNQDSAKAEIERQQQSLISNKYFATINYALNHKEYEVAPYLMLSEAFNAQTKYLDTVYNALDTKVKDSKYGKELESFIKSRKDTVTAR